MSILNLGEQALTGVFPESAEEQVSKGPLELVWCSSCTLLQLAHSYEPTEMYGDNYGYRSGLNRSMLLHLARKARGLESLVGLNPGDVVLDVGSNDGTLLGAYATRSSVASESTRQPRGSRTTTRRMPRSSQTSFLLRSSARSATSQRGSSRRSRCSTTSRTRLRSLETSEIASHPMACGTSSSPTCLRCCAQRRTTPSVTNTSSTTPSRPSAGSSTKPGSSSSMFGSTGSTAAASPSPLLTLARGSRQAGAYRLVRGPRGAHGARHARPVQTLRGEGLPAPHGPHPARQDTSFGRCVGDGLRGLDEGQRPPSVLRVRLRPTSKQLPRSTRTSSGASRRDRESQSSRKTRLGRGDLTICWSSPGTSATASSSGRRST